MGFFALQNSPIPLIHVNFIQKLNTKIANHAKGIHREKAPSNKVPEQTKSMNIDIGASNQLFIGKFLKWNKIFSEKLKYLKGKLWSLQQLHFVLPILFVLTLTSDRAVLYGNVVLSILVLSTKKQHSNFLEKFFVVLKICCKVKVLDTLKISSNCYLKACRSLKRTTILKIPSNVFQQNLCFFCWPQNEISQKKRFPVLGQIPTQVLP